MNLSTMTPEEKERLCYAEGFTEAAKLLAEIDDLNNDGFTEVIIFIQEPNGKKSLFCVSSKENERLEPIYFPDITDDMVLSKGYRGQDDFKLVEGIL